MSSIEEAKKDEMLEQLDEINHELLQRNRDLQAEVDKWQAAAVYWSDLYALKHTQ